MIYFPVLVKKALNKIASRPADAKLLRSIHEYNYPNRCDWKIAIVKARPDKFSIEQNNYTQLTTNRAVRANEKNAMNGIGVPTTIHWNPNLINTPTGSRPAFIGLAHELIHGWHNLRGDALIDNRWEELATVGLYQYESYRNVTENKIRAEHGVQVRTSYDPHTNNYGWIREVH
jgi:hypothetical protein